MLSRQRPLGALRLVPACCFGTVVVSLAIRADLLFWHRSCLALLTDCLSPLLWPMLSLHRCVLDATVYPCPVAARPLCVLPHLPTCCFSVFVFKACHLPLPGRCEDASCDRCRLVGSPCCFGALLFALTLSRQIPFGVLRPRPTCCVGIAALRALLFALAWSPQNRGLPYDHCQLAVPALLRSGP